MTGADKASLKRRKPTASLLTAVGLIFATAITIPAWAATPQQIDESRARALAWLISHQEDDGRWPGQRGVDVPATAQTLEVLQDSGVRSFPHSRGLAWLANADALSVESLARKGRVLAATGTDAGSSLDALLRQRNGSGAWGAYDRFDTTFPDTPLALGAIRGDSARFAAEQVSLTGALGCTILASQRTGDPTTAGSWTYVAGGGATAGLGRGSSVSPTAHNLLEIGAFIDRGDAQVTCPRTGVTYSLSSALNAGADWLLVRQRNANGSFPSGQGNALETALAYLAIARARPTDSALTTAHDYLIAQQLADGSWQGDAFVTATVLKTFGSTTLVDTDADGLPDTVETYLGTDPYVADSRQFANRNGRSEPGVTTPLVFDAVRNQPFAATLASGSLPFANGLVIGALPDGVSLNTTNGAISGTPTSVGYYSFTYQYTDAGSVQHLLLAQIAVRAAPDTTPPVVTAPPALTVEATASLSRPVLGRAFAIDDVDGPLSPTPLPAGPYALGNHTITWRAVDAAGNIGTATQVLVIQDTTPPMIVAPPDIQLLPTGQEPVTVDLGQPSAGDLFGPVQITNNAPSQFPAGETIVTYTARDANDNESTDQQRVAIVYPLPAAVTLSPEFVTVGSNGITLSIGGSGFAPASIVRWNGTNQSTVYVSGSELQISVTAQQLAVAGEANVTVLNPTPGGGLSNTLRFAITEGVVDFFDTFDRADGGAIGNGWIEKSPAAFTLVSGEARKEAVASNYVDNLVYRPAGEDVLDTEASVEFRLLGSTVGYPQVHVRVQAETVAQAGMLDSYLLYVTDSPTQAVLARQGGSSLGGLTSLTLSSALTTGEVYRLRLRAVGTNPVQLSGYVERFNAGAWTIIGQASYSDSEAARIAVAGSVGFSGSYEAGYAYDRFARQRLGDGNHPLPAITTLSPEFATVGEGDLTLTVRGSNFVPSSQVRWNGTGLTTTYLSPTRLTASVPAAQLAAVGTASVTVFNPAPGGGSSAARSFIVYAVGQAPRPVPVLSSTTPSYVVAGSAGFALVANGSGFSADSVIRWNGVALSTTYVSATRLQASIGASAIAVPASITVSVFTPTPGGGSSAGQSFAVLESSALFSDSFDAPDAADLGNGWIEKNPAAFTLVEAEARSQPTSTSYQDNLVYRPANEDVLNVEAGVEFRLLGSAVGYPQLHVRVRSATVAQAGVLDSYLLYIPNDATRAILARQRASSGLTTLVEFPLSSALTTGQVYRLRLRAVGTNPVQLAAYVERWIGESQWELLGQATTNDTSAERLATAGSVGFGSSAVLGNFAYENFTRLDLGAQALPVPTISALSPNTATAGGSDFLLTVTGTNFSTDSVVRWNGTARATTFISATELQATIPATSIANAGTATITVFTSNGGESAPVSFTIRSPLAGSGPVRIILMAGQSNMNGWAGNENADPALLQPNGGTRIYFKPIASSQANGSWQVLQANTNNRLPLNYEHGPELRLAQQLVGAWGGDPPVFIIKYARDATGLDENAPSAAAGRGVWSPSVSGQLYDLFMDYYVRRGLQELIDAGLEPHIQAFIWMQGEEDAQVSGPSGNYETNLAAFIARLRTDLGISDLPVVIGRIHDDMPTSQFPTENVNVVRTAMANVDAADADVYLINTDQYALRTDSLHFDAAGQSAFADDIYAVLSPMGLGAVYAPPARVLTISPDIVAAGGASFTLSVRGVGFTSGSVVRLNGEVRSTTYISTTELRAALSAGDIASVGTASVAVFNPAAETETNSLTLQVIQAGAAFFDDFNRADGAQLGNAWAEKNLDSLILSGGRVAKQSVSTSFQDNLAYRPALEDELNTEVSVEFQLLGGSPGYPQLFARVQSSTVASSGALDGYILYVNNNAAEAILGRQLGSGSVTSLATIAINPVLDSSGTYRLRLRVLGTDPVALNAYIERFDGTNWLVIGQAQYDDASASRIALPGTVGFGGYTEASYVFDNFMRVNLAP